MEESRRDWGKIIVGLVVGGVALLSLLFTIYQFVAHPENREHFIKKLENIRNEPPFPVPGRGD
ncbi:MAG TPA: hypothetical protein EYP11_00075 [Aquificaceae bacterium]|nr:hypothetical protein [Aquificaceae bacterium]HIQ31085.1 hypothetical protein [Aquifex aeolicus]